MLHPTASLDRDGTPGKALKVASPRAATTLPGDRPQSFLRQELLSGPALPQAAGPAGTPEELHGYARAVLPGSSPTAARLPH